MITYASRHEQAEQLAVIVSNELNEAIEQSGTAGLALSGGSTPHQFLKSLSKLTINWSKLVITTSDERWVAVTDERSNARMVNELLCIEEVQRYKFVPLYLENTAPQKAIPVLETLLKEQLPNLDTIILGMGTDGHTASLFPGAENLSQALNHKNRSSVISITAPGAPEPRISLTLAKILSSNHIHLLINGPEKLETLHQAQQLKDPLRMPIYALLELENFTIHYAD